MLVGAIGLGKTLLALQFLLTGAAAYERGLIISFREELPELFRKARHFGLDVQAVCDIGQLTIMHGRARDGDPDVLLGQVLQHILDTEATRVVLDSASELEHIVREWRKRGVFAIALRARGVTGLFICETRKSVGEELDFLDSPLGRLAENVLPLSSTERERKQELKLSVLKARDTQHDGSPRPYELDAGFRMLAVAPGSTAANAPAGASD